MAFEDLRHIDDEVAGALAVFRIEIGGGGKRTAPIAPGSLPASVPRFLRRGVCVESYPLGWRGASAVRPRQSSAENSRRSLDFIRGRQVPDGECAAPRRAARQTHPTGSRRSCDGMAPSRRRLSALTSTAWPLSGSVRRFAGARRGSSGLFPVVSYSGIADALVIRSALSIEAYSDPADREWSRSAPATIKALQQSGMTIGVATLGTIVSTGAVLSVTHAWSGANFPRAAAIGR